MVDGGRGSIGSTVRGLFAEGTTGGLGDGALLRRYVDGGEPGERAFAALVERHGPMVHRVCRAILADEHAALDASQATFLVLATRARGLWVDGSIGPWLHGVARRTALCARASAARRRKFEGRAGSQRAEAVAPASPGDGLAAALHEEVEKLPSGRRSAVVLCGLEGLTHEQAAHRLGWPVGTVRSRLARGRDQLRDRLIRRGLAPAVGLIGLNEAAGRSPAAIKAMAAASTGLGAVPGPVVVLSRLTMRSMLMLKIKAATMAVAILGASTLGAGALARQGFGPPAAGGAPQEPARPIGGRGEVGAGISAGRGGGMVGPDGKGGGFVDFGPGGGGSLGGEPERARMEYDTSTGVKAGSLKDDANRWERSGWEVFQILPKALEGGISGGGEATYVVVVRRPARPVPAGGEAGPTAR